MSRRACGHPKDAHLVIPPPTNGGFCKGSLAYHYPYAVALLRQPRLRETPFIHTPEGCGNSPARGFPASSPPLAYRRIYEYDAETNYLAPPVLSPTCPHHALISSILAAIWGIGRIWRLRARRLRRRTTSRVTCTIRIAATVDSPTLSS